MHRSRSTVVCVDIHQADLSKDALDDTATTNRAVAENVRRIVTPPTLPSSAFTTLIARY